ncbi:MAG: hypothetical protein KAH32_08665 [Chlamydiia bacterium]|nr:hypothetical protein [Chlamydiia bacterium]
MNIMTFKSQLGRFSKRAGSNILNFSIKSIPYLIKTVVFTLAISLLIYAINKATKQAVFARLGKEESNIPETSISHAETISIALRDTIKSNKIFDVNNPDSCKSMLTTMRAFNISSSNDSLFNIAISKFCSPTEVFIYECMVITDILMQEDVLSQYRVAAGPDKLNSQKKEKEIRDTALKKDLDNMSYVILDTIKEHKDVINKQAPMIRKNAYKALSIIKDSYDGKLATGLKTQPTYNEEFLKNLNIVLYMACNDDVSQLDVNFIDNVKKYFSTYFLTNRQFIFQGSINLIKKEPHHTEVDSQIAFVESFKEITKKKHP